MVDLTTFSTAPTTINIRLQMTGPAGGNNSPGNVTVRTGASGGLTETISLITLAAANQQGTAAYSEQGTLGRVTVTAGAGNCYWLPWSSGRAYLTVLGSAQDLFFTYTLNGCGFFVGGSRASPTVVHANADVPRLQSAVVANDGAATMRAQIDIYEQFYAGLLATMMMANQFPSQEPVMFLPKTYLGADSGFGAVFGVRSAGNWTFYYNCRNRTRELWPHFDR